MYTCNSDNHAFEKTLNVAKRIFVQELKHVWGTKLIIYYSIYMYTHSMHVLTFLGWYPLDSH